MTRTIFKPKNIEEKIRSDTRRISSLEIRQRLASNLSSAENVSFQFQATQFVKNKSWGECRINSLTSPTVVNEDTDSNVNCNAELNDIGGSGQAITSPFHSSYIAVPLNDKEGKTAWYHGHVNYLKWEHIHPTVDHTKIFVGGKSLVLNIPGDDPTDRDTFIYYSSHADFNINVRCAYTIWFYPTSFTAGSQTFKMLHYRYIDASNYFMVTTKEGDPFVYMFINYLGTLYKVKSPNPMVAHTWNTIMWAWNPTTPTLALEVNDGSGSIADNPHTEVLTPPHTTGSEMFVGGIPGDEGYRLKGYLAHFWGWTGDSYSATERGRIRTHGTAAIV